VRVVSTLDTLSHCPGTAANAALLAEAGISLLYGTDLAHPDVPWGINAHELMLMAHTGYRNRPPLEVLSAATARAGQHLGLAPLGQLTEDAPADLIGVRGNPLEGFKPLEYPDLVISGGVPVSYCE
jgi:imidazolonepropionase-like amidohydrolase